MGRHQYLGPDGGACPGWGPGRSPADFFLGFWAPNSAAGAIFLGVFEAFGAQTAPQARFFGRFRGFWAPNSAAGAIFWAFSIAVLYVSDFTPLNFFAFALTSILIEDPEGTW